MQKAYRTIREQGKTNEQELASLVIKNGQGLLPMVALIEQCQVACDQLIDMTGRAAIQAVLQLSAMEAAGGPQQQRKRRPIDVIFYGRQAAQVLLSDRNWEIQRPRLRTKRARSQEVEVPVYTAMQNPVPMSKRMLDILMYGISTRNYKQVNPTDGGDLRRVAFGGEPMFSTCESKLARFRAGGQIDSTCRSACL